MDVHGTPLCPVLIDLTQSGRRLFARPHPLTIDIIHEVERSIFHRISYVSSCQIRPTEMYQRRQNALPFPYYVDPELHAMQKSRYQSCDALSGTSALELEAGRDLPLRCGCFEQNSCHWPFHPLAQILSILVDLGSPTLLQLLISRSLPFCFPYFHLYPFSRS
jgi:hypothetical protein